MALHRSVTGIDYDTSQLMIRYIDFFLQHDAYSPHGQTVHHTHTSAICIEQECITFDLNFFYFDSFNICKKNSNILEPRN